jgi:hypothetical protein
MMNSIGSSLFLVAIPATNSAILIGMNFNGQTIAMPNTLNVKCANATAMAAEDPVASEANIAVMVVPTFAPSV